MTENPYAAGAPPQSDRRHHVTRFYIGVGLLCLAALIVGYAVFSMYSGFMAIATAGAGPAIKPSVVARQFSASISTTFLGFGVFATGLFLVVRGFLSVAPAPQNSQNT